MFKRMNYRTGECPVCKKQYNVAEHEECPFCEEQKEKDKKLKECQFHHIFWKLETNRYECTNCQWSFIRCEPTKKGEPLPYVEDDDKRNEIIKNCTNR